MGTKVVILAGGLGTRLAEETETRPKPLVEIGGKPILWHIMKHFAYYGFKEFVIALGYKGEMIRRYFLDYPNMHSHLEVALITGAVQCHSRESEDWVVHLVDTGDATNTGGRLKRLEKWLDETFLVTYGDGVSDVNLTSLVTHHQKQAKTATITAVRPPARFGGLELDGDLVREFTEKPSTGEGWINGGFMVCEPALLDGLDDTSSLELDVLTPLANRGLLAAYRHDGFWQCMDTLRDKRLLEKLWETGAPWRIW